MYATQPNTVKFTHVLMLIHWSAWAVMNRGFVKIHEAPQIAGQRYAIDSKANCIPTQFPGQRNSARFPPILA